MKQRNAPSARILRRGGGCGLHGEGVLVLQMALPRRWGLVIIISMPVAGGLLLLIVIRGSRSPLVTFRHRWGLVIAVSGSQVVEGSASPVVVTLHC
jgi:hypothetical protein